VTPQGPPRATPSNVNLPDRPYWLCDVGKGDIDFAHIFSALRDPADHVEHDDETASLPPGTPAGTPLPVKPRNPAGSANTAWTSRKYLVDLEIPGRHRH
jgi:hypothetical protein